MRLILLCVGRCKAGPETELSQRYIERANAAGRALGFPRVELREFDVEPGARAGATQSSRGQDNSGEPQPGRQAGGA